MISGELENIALNEASQFHILRHFIFVDPEYKDKMITGFGYSSAKITEQIQLPGGKFLQKFAANPVILWNLCKNKMGESGLEITWNEDRGYVNILFSSTDFPGGIGLDGIVRIDELNESDREFIHDEERDGFTIKIFNQVSKRATCQANVAFQRNDSGIFINTIFPGTFAPPFPKKEIQPEPIYKANREFWDNYALVK